MSGLFNVSYISLLNIVIDLNHVISKIRAVYSVPELLKIVIITRRLTQKRHV